MYGKYQDKDGLIFRDTKVVTREGKGSECWKIWQKIRENAWQMMRYPRSEVLVLIPFPSCFHSLMILASVRGPRGLSVDNGHRS